MYIPTIASVAENKRTTPLSSTLKNVDCDPPSDQTVSNATEQIWCRKKPTDTDLEATSRLLKLRQEMASSFDDKKTIKAKLWQKISIIMQEKFNIGENGSEKCRQKFCNLQRTYLAYIKHQKTTGSGRNDDLPPFFAELHSILSEYV